MHMIQGLFSRTSIAATRSGRSHQDLYVGAAAAFSHLVFVVVVAMLSAARRLPAISRRLLSSASGNNVVVATAVGPDRTGFVADVTSAIALLGGNVTESQSSKLRGTFSMSLLVEMEGENDEAALHAAIQKELPDCYVQIAAASPIPSSVPAFTGRFSVDTADHPGLISSVSRYIAGKGINIHQMKTRQASAPFSATPLFSMSGTLSSFKEVDVEGLKKGLRRLEDDLNVDIDFKET